MSATGNVTLRPLRPDDWRLLLAWSQDEETRRLQSTRPEAHTPASARTEVERIIAGQGQGHMAFMVEVEGQTVGNCWLGHLSSESASLGIVIAPGWRDRGIGSAAMARLLECAGNRRVELWATTENSRAIHLYRKLGFIETSRRDGRVFMVKMARQSGNPSQRTPAG